MRRESRDGSAAAARTAGSSSPRWIEGLRIHSAETNQEEIFGPVASLLPFENETDAIQLANDTRYGLAASVWTR